VERSSYSLKRRSPVGCGDAVGVGVGAGAGGDLGEDVGVRIEYADAVEAALAVHILHDEDPTPLLVNLVGLRSVTAGARAGLNAYRSYTKVALVGDNPMGAVLTAFSRRSHTRPGTSPQKTRRSGGSSADSKAHRCRDQRSVQYSQRRLFKGP
jgi:hypothetical protein